MNIELKWDSIIAIVVMLLLFLIIYSKVKNQRLSESFDELKELVVRPDE